MIKDSNSENRLLGFPTAKLAKTWYRETGEFRKWVCSYFNVRFIESLTISMKQYLLLLCLRSRSTFWSMWRDILSLLCILSPVTIHSGTYDTHFCVCLFVLCPTREFITHLRRHHCRWRERIKLNSFWGSWEYNVNMNSHVWY